MKKVVGEILKPQGIRGEVKIKPLVDDENCFYDFDEIFIDENCYKIKSKRVHQGFVYLSFNGITDRNFVENLRGKMIEVNEEEMPRLQDGQYYITDLEDCTIYFEDGEKVGKIFEVNNYGASGVLTIKCGTEEILCPFLPHIFTEIDVDAKKIIADKQSFLEVTDSEDWCFNLVSKQFFTT